MACGSPVFLLVYFEDVDAVTAQAVSAGAKVPVQARFYRDRSGTIADPLWTLATRKEDVSKDEMERRMAGMRKS